MNERAQAATHPYPFERTGELLESHGLEPTGARRTAEAHRELPEARKGWLERLLEAVRRR
jgi:hypothetical protein